jgi:ATP-dependent helicase HrpB
MLELAQWGIQNVNDLQWLTPPPPGSVNQARELLRQLEATDEQGITGRGKEMLKLPTHPRIAHLLLEAKHDPLPALLTVATDVAALLEERDPLSKDAGADLWLRVDVLRKWRGGDRVNADRGVLERIERLATSWRQLFRVQKDNMGVPDHTDHGPSHRKNSAVIVLCKDLLG